MRIKVDTTRPLISGLLVQCEVYSFHRASDQSTQPLYDPNTSHTVPRYHFLSLKIRTSLHHSPYLKYVANVTMQLVAGKTQPQIWQRHTDAVADTTVTVVLSNLCTYPTALCKWLPFNEAMADCWPEEFPLESLLHVDDEIVKDDELVEVCCCCCCCNVTGDVDSELSCRHKSPPPVPAPFTIWWRESTAAHVNTESFLVWQHSDDTPLPLSET